MPRRSATRPIQSSRDYYCGGTVPTGCTSDSGPGGLEAGSGFGFGLVRGVLFSLFLVSVLCSVPGTGRVSSSEAQLHKGKTAPKSEMAK